MNIVFVVNRINRFFKVTTRDTHLLKLSDKVSNGLSDLSRVYFYPDFLRKNKYSYTWSQIAPILCFLSLTLSKTKILYRHLRIFIHFSFIFGKFNDCKHCFIPIFVKYKLNKIVLNFKVFKFMAFLTFLIFLFYLLNIDFIHKHYFIC